MKEIGQYCDFADPMGYYRSTPIERHDWRLIEREAIAFPSFWKETWYCTRCRVVDERRVLRSPL